jgi:hypothetical protein
MNRIFEGDVFVDKKNGAVINIKDYICEFVISEEINELCSFGEYKFIDVVLKTNQEMYLNPENIIKAINLKYAVDDYFIKKIEVYDKNGGIFR